MASALSHIFQAHGCLPYSNPPASNGVAGTEASRDTSEFGDALRGNASGEGDNFSARAHTRATYSRSNSQHRVCPESQHFWNCSRSWFVNMSVDRMHAHMRHPPAVESALAEDTLGQQMAMEAKTGDCELDFACALSQPSRNLQSNECLKTNADQNPESDDAQKAAEQRAKEEAIRQAFEQVSQLDLISRLRTSLTTGLRIRLRLIVPRS